MEPTAPPAGPEAYGFLTIEQAAEQLDMDPWQVVREVQAGNLAAATVIPREGIRRFQEMTR